MRAHFNISRIRVFEHLLLTFVGIQVGATPQPDQLRNIVFSPGLFTYKDLTKKTAGSAFTRCENRRGTALLEFLSNTDANLRIPIVSYVDFCFETRSVVRKYTYLQLRCT